MTWSSKALISLDITVYSLRKKCLNQPSLGTLLVIGLEKLNWTGQGQTDQSMVEDWAELGRRLCWVTNWAWTFFGQTGAINFAGVAWPKLGYNYLMPPFHQDLHSPSSISVLGACLEPGRNLQELNRTILEIIKAYMELGELEQLLATHPFYLAQKHRSKNTVLLRFLHHLFYSGIVVIQNLFRTWKEHGWSVYRAAIPIKAYLEPVQNLKKAFVICH